jgi:ketosteroid isomerase-like protein
LSGDARARQAETVRELLRRISAQEFDRAVELVTDRFRFELPYRSPDVPEPLSGRAAFLATMKSSLGAFDPMRMELLSLHALDAPDQWVAEYTSNTRYHPTGRPYRNLYVGFFRFEGDRIVFWREYHNPDILAEAMRPPER